MSEESSDGTTRVGAEFMAFLVEQNGGQEAAQAAFRKHLIRETFKMRSSADVKMCEILDLFEDNNWIGWLRGLSIIEFLTIFTKNLGLPMPRSTTAAPPTKNKNVSEAKVALLMEALGKTPWMSKEEAQKILGFKSWVTAANVIQAMLDRGLIKRHRGKRVLFAQATNTTPPPE